MAVSERVIVDLPSLPPERRRTQRIKGAYGKNWRRDKYGNLVPPPLIDRFIDWMADPYRNPAMTQAEWADANGVSPSTLQGWLKDERVRDLLDKRLAILNAEPTRVQQVVQAVFERALLGDVKAATLYLQYVDKLTPKKVINLYEARDLKAMNDEQFREHLLRAVQLLEQPTGRVSLPRVIDVKEGYALDQPGRQLEDEEGEDDESAQGVVEDG